MAPEHLDEATVEDVAQHWLEEIGYTVGTAAHDAATLRENSSDTILSPLVTAALKRLNPEASADLIDTALQRIHDRTSTDTMRENQQLHTLMIHGIPVETTRDDGTPLTTRLKLIDFDTPHNNDWRALNQFNITENRKTRRPDLLIFLNGLPVGLVELKNPADHNATLRHAWNQIQTYRRDIPSVFIPNAITVISDGMSAAMSSFSAPYEHYAPWKTIDSSAPVTDRPALETLLKGVFEPGRFCDILKNFVVYSEETRTAKTGQKVKITVKRVAKYHQYGPSIKPSNPLCAPPAQTVTSAAESCGTRKAQVKASQCCSAPKNSCETFA